jgi:cytidyltransferase-like protein
MNPLHHGHIDYFEAARKLGDQLVVVVNNDKQVCLKGSCPFMSERDRLRIVGALKVVDLAFLSIDDDRSVNKTLEMLCRLLNVTVLANGGDVGCEADCREAETCKRLGIEMVFGVGGTEKSASSSAILAAAGWCNPSPSLNTSG